MHILKKLAYLFIAILSFSAKAQDIHFSQMKLAPLTVNPALTGLNGKYHAVVNYRNQWNSVATPFNTIGASFDMKFGNNHHERGFLAAGINMFYDIAGTQKMTTSNVNANIAYHIRINEDNTFGLGLMGGFNQRGLGRVDGMFASQYDGIGFNPDIPSGENFERSSFGFFDMGGGFVYHHNSISRNVFDTDGFELKIGFAGYHLIKPDYSFIQGGNDDLAMRFTGFFESEFILGDSPWSLMPAIYYQRQGAHQEIFFGSFVKYRIISSSIRTEFVENFSIAYAPFYRFGDAFVNKLYIEYKEFGLGFSYDVNVSSLTQASKGRGGFEIAFRYSLIDPHLKGRRIR